MSLKLVASLLHRKILIYRKKITSIILLCITSQFYCVTKIAEVIDTIAIRVFFNHSIRNNWFLDCNHLNCYVNNNSVDFCYKRILFINRKYLENCTIWIAEFFWKDRGTEDVKKKLSKKLPNFRHCSRSTS